MTVISLYAQDWSTFGNALVSPAILGTTTSVPLDFYTSNTLQMTIDINGSVGIGTISPFQLLHINGPDFNSVYTLHTNAYSSSGFYEGISLSGHGDIRMKDKFNINFMTNSIPRMQIYEHDTTSAFNDGFRKCRQVFPRDGFKQSGGNT